MSERPGPWRVRDLQADDLEPLLRLYQQLHSADPPLPRERALELWQAILGDPAQIYLGGFAGDELVSACCAAIVPNLTRAGRPYAVIENVITAADYRRKGLGREVLEALIVRCWQRDCYKIMLMSGSVRGEAHSFYEAIGFDRLAKQAFTIRRP
ncbi:MAG TPA: GNAT family N-acetyltransferase [Polyangiales bacterium]|nr:GNAT family N-acetyltransferase [Polyangiales bacterium]